MWRGRRVRAFVPTPLEERDLTLDARTAARCGEAAAHVAHGAEALPDAYAPLARLLLRAEGIASSFIEGVTAPVVDVVLAEQCDGEHSPAAWVAANLAATSHAVDHASGSAPLTLDLVRDWHAELMRGSPTPARQVGEVRDQQGWIGGTSPLDAHLVTPPPDELPRLLDDLLTYVNRDNVDPVAQSAIAHAQFEVIHPFADGNGRIGRVLVSWLLTRRLALLAPPPVSVRLAADVGGYAAGLTRFRFGATNGWVGWFADAVSGAGEAQRDLVAQVEQLKAEWRERLRSLKGVRSLRSDASAWDVLDLLPRHLLLTSRVVSDELGLTPKAARDALDTLAHAGVLETHDAVAVTGRGRPAILFVSSELLGLTGSSPLRR